MSEWKQYQINMIWELAKDLGKTCWNDAVLACEDAARDRFDEALVYGATHKEAFDEAMEEVQKLKWE